MHALVVGGTRFVGTLLVWRLLAAGHRVTLVNRGTTKDPFGNRVQRLHADRRTAGLERVLAGRAFDVVYDLAAFTAEDGRRAAEILAGACVHYVAISSGQVYLVRDSAPRPAREEDYDGPLLPRPAAEPDAGEWDYGAGKRGLEDALFEAHRTRGFPATTVRIPIVNGEADYYRRLERYLWRLLDGGPVLLPDGGENVARHVYGGEVARFLVSIAADARTIGRAWNLAQEEAPTVAALVASLRDLVGSASPVVAAPAASLRDRAFEPRRISPFSTAWMSHLDPSRARDELGFRHEPLDAYLGKIVAAFLARVPASPPEGLERRAEEIRLGRELAAAEVRARGAG